MTQMVIFRLIQGAAGAAMIPSSQAILMETFPPDEQALAMAVYGIGIVAAPVIGPTLGGWITDNWSWRWNFYINVPIGIFAAVMVYIFVHDPEFMREARKKARRIDYLGIVYLALGLGLLQIVLDRGQRADWFAANWVCLFTAAAVLMLVLLVVRELRFPEPILDLTILKIPVFVISVSIITFMYLIIYGANLLNPLFFQELLGYSAWRAGLTVVPRGVGTLIAMLLIAQFARRGFDTRWLVGVGFAVLAYSLWTMGHWTLDVGPDNMHAGDFPVGGGGRLDLPHHVGRDPGMRGARADGVRGQPVRDDAQYRFGGRDLAGDQSAQQPPADPSVVSGRACHDFRRLEARPRRRRGCRARRRCICSTE